MGSLHPAGALYERPVNLKRSRASHSAFVTLLRHRGVDVRDVRDVLTERVSWSVGDRVALEDLAFNCLRYRFASRDDDDDMDIQHSSSVTSKTISSSNDDSNSHNLSDEEQYCISDRYKRAVIDAMGEQQLVDIIFTNPTVTVSPSPRDTGFVASYRFDPLSNIIFVRDQQITTRRGIVMARLRSPQRARETDIMRFCFDKLGLHVVGSVPPPGHLEGGDFFPAGPKLSLLGIGPRSDWPAAEFLLKEDLFGTEVVAIVKDEHEQKQERMHLDTVFNIISDDCCLMLEEMMGEESATRRMVDEYVLVDSVRGAQVSEDSPVFGMYVLARSDIEFSRYMTEAGFNIITVSGEEQLAYGCNGLNLGNNHLVSIEKRVARRIACSPLFKGTVEYLDFEGVTCMFGGVHCASQVVYRRSEETTEVEMDNSSELRRRSGGDRNEERNHGNGMNGASYGNGHANGRDE